MARTARTSSLVRPVVASSSRPDQSAKGEHGVDTQPATPTTPGAQYLLLPPKDDANPRWSFLSSPVPDLSFTAASPVHSSAFSLHSDDMAFDADRRIASPVDMPESPSAWPSPPIPSAPPKEHDPNLSALEGSMSRSWSAGDASLMDPQLPEPSAPPPPPDDTLLSISQYSSDDNTQAMSEIVTGPLNSTPPPSPRAGAGHSPRAASFDIAGRPLPTAPPTSDPRFAFPPLDVLNASPDSKKRKRPTFKTIGGLASGSRGRVATEPPPVPTRSPERPPPEVKVARPSQDNGDRGYWETSSSKEAALSSPPRPESMQRSRSEPGGVAAKPFSGVQIRPSAVSPAGDSFRVDLASPVIRDNMPTFVPPKKPTPIAVPQRSRLRANTLEDGGALRTPAESPVGGKDFSTSSRECTPPKRETSKPRPAPLSLNELRGREPPTRVADRQRENPVTFPPLPAGTFARSTAPPSPSISPSSYEYRPPRAPALVGTPPMTPPHTRSTKFGSISSGGFPFPPAHPPGKATPTIPAFTSVFVDPATDTVPLSPITNRLSRMGPTIASEPSRYRVSDWLQSKGDPQLPASHIDNNVSLRALSARADLVEAKLASGSDSITTSKAMKRRSKGAGDSLLSFGYRDVPSHGSVPNRASWSRLTDDLPEEDAERVRKRETKAMKKVVDGRRKTQDWLATVYPAPPPKRKWWRRLLVGDKYPQSKPLRSSRRFRLLVGIFLLVLLAVVIAAAVAASRPKATSAIGDCHCENGGAASLRGSTCECSCKGSWGGSFCQLDGSCMSVAGYTLAKSLNEIANSANAGDFSSQPIDINRLALVVNKYLVTSSSHSNCRVQLGLVAIPSLSPTAFPNRLAWTEQAVLWTAAQSESNSTGLLDFVATRSFTGLGDAPGVSNSNFQYIASGYIIDLSAWTVTVPSSSWTTYAAPSADQIALVSTTSLGALDRLTAAASAASTQHTTALWHLWQEYNLSLVDLASFKKALRAAPVMIPLDAAATFGGTAAIALANLQTSNTSFPPSIGCQSALTPTEVAEVNAVEGTTFGLANVTASQSLDAACLDRPLYGVLNPLQLRLPFLPSDTRSNLPKQALVVSSDSYARMTIHAGEVLVGAAAGSPLSPSAPSTISHFSTFKNLDHLVFDFLTLVSANVAQEYVAFVLSGSTTPPSATSTLALAAGDLAKLPMFEVQLWGGLRYPNSDHVVSALATSASPSTSFFGTTLGQTFRQWAVNGPRSAPLTGGSVRWALDALQQKVVVDNSLTSAAFNKVWSATGTSAPDSVWAGLLAAGLGT